MKRIVYIDMDNVLVDFKSAIEQIDSKILHQYEGRYDEIPGIFAKMKPFENAIESVYKLAEKYDLYLLSTAPWLNASAWQHKVEWVQKYFGIENSSLFYKRLILTHHKNLNKGAFLIDDRPNNGAEKFGGTWLHFGSEQFPDWYSIVNYLMD